MVNQSDFICSITDIRHNESIGEKTRGIKFLFENNFLIPNTYVCSSKAYEEYLNSGLLKFLEEEIESKIDLKKNYSVRSSASIEDDPSHSFAGQFQSYLNISGKSNIIKSIEKVWNSTKTNKINSYLRKSGLNFSNIQMAVLIQQMVEAEVSGVVFTKNPMNGRDEIIIEAVSGFGDTLLQGGVNPYRGIYKWGQWLQKPEIPKMPLEIVEEVVNKSKILEQKKRAPLNLEWAYDGKSLYWLQLREITTISDLSFYSNKMAKEFLPGTIKPLIWSVNIPLVCGAWISLLSELLPELNLRPEDLAKKFYNRAYFNMGAIGKVFEEFGMPKEGLEVLMGYGIEAPAKPSMKPGLKSLKHFPNLIRFMWDKIFFERGMKKFIKNNDQEIKKICINKFSTLGILETFLLIESLFFYNKKAAYFVIVSQLLHSIYNRIFVKMIEKRDLHLDDINIEVENNEEINPNHGICDLYKKYKRLEDEDQKCFRSFFENNAIIPNNLELEKFREEFNNFMEKFGHLSDQGNDFSRITWREQPLILLDLVANYENSLIFKNKKTKKTHKVSGLFFNLINKKVRDALEYKEKISFNYVKSYGLFRKYFLHLSRLFVDEGFYEDSEDIFYLTFTEIKNIIKDNNFSAELHSKIMKRRQEILDYENVELPDVIYGDQSPILPKKSFIVKKLSGIPASKGYYTGKSCVVMGVKDFSKVKNGDVVIIPFSDISWAPIFAKAGAVIAESGGILSHSAIITREYGIPCIVGVNRACQIGDDVKIHLDGFSGRITIE
jgi:pyruvate,water dikinase